MTNGSQAYLKTKVLTASPAELRLMLIDGAIRFSEQARRGYERRDFEAAFDGTTKAQAILMELLNSLRPDQAPELCKRLSALYTFMYNRLVAASSAKDAALVDEVIELLRFERETWSMCMNELARENHAAAGMRGGAIGAASAAAPSKNPTTAGGLVGGRVSVSG
jgi:flagellar protein FliS